MQALATAKVANAQRSDCGDWNGVCAPNVQSDGYVYSFDGAALSRSRPPAGEHVSEEQEGMRKLYEYAYTPACWPNQAPDADGIFNNPDVNCTQSDANPFCPPAEFAMWTFRRLVGPPQALLAAPGEAQWDQRGITCIGSQEQWTVAELTQILGEYLEDRVGRPEIVAQPPDGGIVNVPLIVHTADAPPIDDFEVTQPVPGSLHAVPSYEWDFGEGDVKTVGPGRPYTAAVSPFDNPDYYVAYAYTDSGDKQVTLTMTWTATFTVQGLVVPLDAIEFTDTVAVPVRSARSELVAEPAG